MVVRAGGYEDEEGEQEEEKEERYQIQQQQKYQRNQQYSKVGLINMHLEQQLRFRFNFHCCCPHDVVALMAAENKKVNGGNPNTIKNILVVSLFNTLK